MLILLITILVGIIIVGVLLWGIQNFPWIDADFKHAAKIIVVVIFVIWALSTLLGYAPALSFPTLRR